MADYYPFLGTPGLPEDSIKQPSPDPGHLIETADTTPDVRTPHRVTPHPPNPPGDPAAPEPTDRTAAPWPLSPTHQAQEPDIP